jgi:hypothetical protein
MNGKNMIEVKIGQYIARGTDKYTDWSVEQWFLNCIFAHCPLFTKSELP